MELEELRKKLWYDYYEYLHHLSRVKPSAKDRKAEKIFQKYLESKLKNKTEFQKSLDQTIRHLDINSSPILKVNWSKK